MRFSDLARAASPTGLARRCSRCCAIDGACREYGSQSPCCESELLLVISSDVQKADLVTCIFQPAPPRSPSPEFGPASRIVVGRTPEELLASVPEHPVPEPVDQDPIVLLPMQLPEQREDESLDEYIARIPARARAYILLNHQEDGDRIWDDFMISENPDRAMDSMMSWFPDASSKVEVLRLGVERFINWRTECNEVGDAISRWAHRNEILFHQHDKHGSHAAAFFSNVDPQGLVASAVQEWQATNDRAKKNLAFMRRVWTLESGEFPFKTSREAGLMEWRSSRGTISVGVSKTLKEMAEIATERQAEDAILDVLQKKQAKRVAIKARVREDKGGDTSCVVRPQDLADAQQTLWNNWAASTRTWANVFGVTGALAVAASSSSAGPVPQALLENEQGTGEITTVTPQQLMAGPLAQPSASVVEKREPTPIRQVGEEEDLGAGGTDLEGSDSGNSTDWSEMGGKTPPPGTIPRRAATSREKTPPRRATSSRGSTPPRRGGLRRKVRTPSPSSNSDSQHSDRSNMHRRAARYRRDKRRVAESESDEPEEEARKRQRREAQDTGYRSPPRRPSAAERRAKLIEDLLSCKWGDEETLSRLLDFLNDGIGASEAQMNRLKALARRLYSEILPRVGKAKQTQGQSKGWRDMRERQFGKQRQ